MSLESTPKVEFAKPSGQDDADAPEHEIKVVTNQGVPSDEGKSQTESFDEIDDTLFNQELIEKLRAAFGEIPKLGIEKILEVDKQASKRTEMQLIGQHRIFARKVFDYLKMCLGLEVPGDQKHDEYYERYMGEAVMAISMIFREEWRMIFTRIHNSLSDPIHFVLYCCTIPIERNSRFFIDYLQRVAIIFEMVLYMFDDGHDFFEIGANCAAEFVDVIFFKKEGDWPLLKKTAAMICMTTRPLRFVVSCPKEGTKCFGDVIRKLEEYMDANVINMTTEECKLLHKLNGKRDSYVAALKRRRPFDEEMEVTPEEKELIEDLFSFLGKCLRDSRNEMDKTVTFFDKDQFEICLQSWLDSSQVNVFKEVREMIRDHQKGIVSETELKESLEQKDATIKDSHRGSKFQKVLKKVQTKGVSETKSVKRKVREGISYYSYKSTHVKWFLKIYTRGLLTYINEYNRRYIVPSYTLECITENEDIFVIDQGFYKKRQELVEKRTMKGDTRMWACLLPSKELRVLPIQVQRLFDYFVDKNMTGHLDIPGVEKPMLVIPKLLGRIESRPVWVIKGLLEKSGALLEKGIAIKDRVDRLLKKTFRTCQVEVSQEKLEEFRLQAKLKIKVLGIPKTPSKSPKTSSKSPKKTPSKTSKSPKIPFKSPEEFPKKFPKTPMNSPSSPSTTSQKTPSSSSSKTPSKSPRNDDKLGGNGSLC